MAVEKLRILAQKLKEAPKKWLKKPWEITGPCSSPEYVHALPNATEYRVFSPATPPTLPYIVNAEPDRVYNIVYHSRDTRRNFRDRRRYILSKEQLEAESQKRLPDINKCAGLGSYHLVTRVIDPDHEPGDGYQK